MRPFQNTTLKVLGNQTEFQRVASLLQDTIDFDTDVNASVFETNIRGTKKQSVAESDYIMESDSLCF